MITKLQRNFLQNRERNIFKGCLNRAIYYNMSYEFIMFYKIFRRKNSSIKDASIKALSEWDIPFTHERDC